MRELHHVLSQINWLLTGTINWLLIGIMGLIYYQVDCANELQGFINCLLEAVSLLTS